MRHRTRLTTVELLIAQAWLTAGVDLGIQVDVDGEVDQNGTAGVPYAVRIHWFGRVNGTVCRHGEAPRDEVERLRDWARRNETSCSLLSGSYTTYDRDLFVETLDDWQWFGEAKPPGWYTGKPAV
jgi:hypothetical protein